MELKARLNLDGIDIAARRVGDTFSFSDVAELTFDTFQMSIKARLNVKKDGNYRLTLIFSDLGTYSHVFIPSVWYRGNHEGEGMFPSEKTSPYWSFMEHRMPIPGIMVYVTDSGSKLFTIDPARNPDEFSSVYWGRDGVGYMIPGKEAPFSYRGKKALVDTSSEMAPSIHLSAGDVYEREITVFETECRDELSVYETFLREHVDLSPIIPDISWLSYGESKLVRLLNLTYPDGEGNAYIKMGEENGDEQDIYEFTSASFLVKSLEAATVFASIDPDEIAPSDELDRALYRIRDMFGDDTDLRKLAELIGNHFLKAESEKGIFRDCEDLHSGEKGGYLGIGEHPEFKYLVNARTNGEAMSSYVDLYELTGKQEYLEIAKRVASFYIDNQMTSGSFGRWWSVEGIPVNCSGTNGAYIGVFLLKLLKHLDGNDERRCREAVLKALTYYGSLALDGDFFGDTLDADSADKEAGISLMSLLLEASEVLGEMDSWTVCLRKCASFILSWVWHYDEFFSLSSPLGKEDFHTKGMSSVSIAHHHLDFYGMLIARDFLRLYRLTGDEFYRKEAIMMASACRELIALKPGDLGRNLYGYQPEQVNHTSWDYFNREERMNGTYDIDIAWNNVLGLSSYLYIRKEFPEVL